MFKNILICCISVLLFYACNRFEKQQTKKTAIVNDSLKNIKPTEDTLNSVAKGPETVYFNTSKTIIREEFRDSLFTKFSDSLTDDKFIFTMPEGNINQTTSVFQIFNNADELIYEKSFDTHNLINGYDLEYIKSDEEMEKYILDRAKKIVHIEFIDISDRNEIKKDDVLGQSKDMFENYDVFKECQNNKTPLFTIFLGEEDTTYIGYSKKLKKAVDIISCC